jgi:DHA2 family multidrug resistance protein
MLRKEEIGNASGIYNLMRNIGGSVGIALISTTLVRGAQIHQNYLSAHLTPGSARVTELAAGLSAKYATGGASHADAQRLAIGSIYRLLQQQASLLAYADAFRLIGYMGLACLPLVIAMARAHQQRLRRGEGQESR